MFNAIVKQDLENALNFSLYFQDLDREKCPKLRVRMVDGEKFFMPLYGKTALLPLIFPDPEQKSAYVHFSLPELLPACGITSRNCRVLEFLLCYDGAEEFLACEDGFSTIEVEQEYLTYKMCPGSGGNLVLRLAWKELWLTGRATPEPDGFLVELDTRLAGKLVMRHRIERGIACYDGDTIYEMSQPGQCKIPYRDLVGRMTTDHDMFCLFYRVGDGVSTPEFDYRILTEEDMVKYKKGKHQFITSKTQKGLACLESRRNRKKTVITAANVGEEQKLSFAFSELEPEEIRLRRVISFPGSRDGGERKVAQDNAFVFPEKEIPLDSWGHLHTRQPLLYQVVAVAGGAEFWAVSETALEQSWELEHQTVTLTASPKGCFLRIAERENRIRLGILGTCMTRWAFSRKYTDAYRSLFDVRFAHFWPSVFSLMEEPIPFPEELYGEYPEQELLPVRREYEKTTLADLEKADCEYILLDFFVDAIHGPRRLKDGRFIGYKAYSRDFYQDHLLLNSEKYYVDTNGYFGEWKKAADKLIGELKKRFPEHRIVLATGGLTHYYFNGDGQVECFDGKTLRGSDMTKHSIDGLNYLWDRMNAYFIEKMPDAQILNMRQYNFLAHDNNPANVRPYHYVKEYYRTMSAELSRIILWDRQNHPWG